jgi:hypothetical protein
MNFAGCKKMYDGKLKMQKREAPKDLLLMFRGPRDHDGWVGGWKRKLLASATITIARNRL